MSFSDFVARFWQDIAGWLVLINFVVTAGTLLWVLQTKRETMSAIAWSLTVLLLTVRAFLFFIFGYQHRRLSTESGTETLTRSYLTRTASPRRTPDRWDTPQTWPPRRRLSGHRRNAVALYPGRPAFDAMLKRPARGTIHIQFFIFRSDASGRSYAARASKEPGVQVRFLYDSVGSYNLCGRPAATCDQGCAAAFLPMLNPLYRWRVNLRNHRKILVVDGRIGFTGGLNIGDEYLGLHPKFGPWRDTHLRVEGPAVEGLQRIFLEDWQCGADEAVHGEEYYPRFEKLPGSSLVQVVHSGPDAEYKAIRETYFAGILSARKRVWIASPYFVPDGGLRDACVCGAIGIDVLSRLFRPDKLDSVPRCIYWTDMLAAGGRSTSIHRDDTGSTYRRWQWASVGSANLDNGLTSTSRPTASYSIRLSWRNWSANSRAIWKCPFVSIAKCSRTGR